MFENIYKCLECSKIFENVYKYMKMLEKKTMIRNVSINSKSLKKLLRLFKGPLPLPFTVLKNTEF